MVCKKDEEFSDDGDDSSNQHSKKHLKENDYKEQIIEQKFPDDVNEMDYEGDSIMK